MQLSDNVLLAILEAGSSSFLRRINGFCKLSRMLFLKKGAYFTSFLYSDDYFIYLLGEDKYELFVNFMDKGHLYMKDASLFNMNGYEIRYCYANKTKAPEKSRIAGYLSRKGVCMDCSCMNRCYIP
ncbi:Hypothetical protein BQ3484_209 [Cedratvirus A11]|uniref:Uncharacterized protein n=1 Tax=Cedratvirus A11 TaxID=1903266 RepID=A0A1M7XUE4_9VIRU|nr:Hypothetical protein BQ3484_209 [Cedratvirus A11]SHO33277.1 Hypothetical protein BQ3484_209 [Cedratvirus A11]